MEDDNNAEKTGTEIVSKCSAFQPKMNVMLQ